MSQPKTSRIPAPLYAAAGAGDVAYQQLRRLPAVVTGLSDPATRAELRDKAVTTTAELRDKAVTTTAELRDKAVATTAELVSTLRHAHSGAAGLRVSRPELNLDRLREAAVRNAAVVVAGAQAAQERALAVYGELVARGERVVGTGVVRAAETVDADMATTGAATAVASAPAEAAGPGVAEGTLPAETATTTADGPAEKRTAGSGTATPKRRPAAKSTRPATKRTRPATTRRTNPPAAE